MIYQEIKIDWQQSFNSLLEKNSGIILEKHLEKNDLLKKICQTLYFDYNIIYSMFQMSLSN